MNMTEDALWDKGQDLLEQYEELEDELSAMSMIYEDPPVDRAQWEKLDAYAESIKVLSPLAAEEIDRLRDKRVATWQEADRPFWYGEMVEVAYEFNAIRDALYAVIADLEAIGEMAGAPG